MLNPPNPPPFPSIPTVPSNRQPTITRNPDGSYTRFLNFPTTPATPDQNPGSHVLSKDLPLNPENQTWLRIYVPQKALNQTKKLPIIIYFHGGGFVFLSAGSSFAHEFCVKTSAQLDGIVISVEYRLAPEHRLPAAYDDAVAALHWVKAAQEEWLFKFGDFKSCYLMGTSAGGNIAYHAGLRVCTPGVDLEPLIIRGLILHHPFFGGSKRTGSELRLWKDPLLPPYATDNLWELSLPMGENRDHEYCNPVGSSGSDTVERVRAVGLRVLVTGCYDDPIIDRQIQLAKMLEDKGVHVAAHFSEGTHSIELRDDSKAMELFSIVEDFISAS